MNIFDVLLAKKAIPAPWEKYYKNEDLNIDIPNISMYDQILISSHHYPNNKAIVYLGKKITFKKLINLIDRAAFSFNKLGVKKGDIISICLPNVPEALITLYALNKLGAIANMIHPLSAEEEIKESIISTNSKFLVIGDLFYEKIENTIGKTKIKNVLLVSPADSMPFHLKYIYKVTQFGKFKKAPINKKYIKFPTFVRRGKKNKSREYRRFGKNTPAVIIHSGGTSGNPKNVVIQNRAFILQSKQDMIALNELEPGDSCLAIMPNFHGFGLSVCMHTPLAIGCHTILVPTFDAKKFDVLINKTKPTCIVGVPTLFEALIHANNIKKLDLSFLKYVVSGGDSLSPTLESEVNDYLYKHHSNTRVSQGYGLSEALAAVCLNPKKGGKSGSIGIPFPGNYIKIVSPSTRKTLKYGSVGEIVVHTKALMMGYLNNESESNAALQVHSDGHVWLHTGDLGYMDKDGFIFYQGRQKRMIITSGYNVYPSHVEEVIETHPAVLQCSIVGIPHPYKQEVCKAFIVLKEGYHWLFVKQDIKNYCKKHLARYMVPYEFVYRKQLPKTKLGKVDFKALQSDIGDSDPDD